jgi:hypothetical protein
MNYYFHKRTLGDAEATEGMEANPWSNDIKKAPIRADDLVSEKSTLPVYHQPGSIELPGVTNSISFFEFGEEYNRVPEVMKLKPGTKSSRSPNHSVQSLTSLFSDFYNRFFGRMNFKPKWKSNRSSDHGAQSLTSSFSSAFYEKEEVVDEKRDQPPKVDTPIPSNLPRSIKSPLQSSRQSIGTFSALSSVPLWLDLESEFGGSSSQVTCPESAVLPSIEQKKLVFIGKL